MMGEHGYLENIMYPMREMKKTLDYNHMRDNMVECWNHSDDKMSFITYCVMYRHAFNGELKQKFVRGHQLNIGRWNDQRRMDYGKC